MRRDRFVHLVCALLGALASLIVVIDFWSRPSPPLREPSAPAPPATPMPAPEVVSLPPAPPREPPAELSETLYRTPSGKRYHRATCGHVKGKGIELSLAEAKERGLTPCRVCNPPTLP